MTIIEAIAKVTKELQTRWPNCPVTCNPSASSQRVWCVRVFAVPNDQLKAVTQVIHDVGHELSRSNPGCDLLALPKSIAVTQEAYPDVKWKK